MLWCIELPKCAVRAAMLCSADCAVENGINTKIRSPSRKGAWPTDRTGAAGVVAARPYW